MHDLVVCQVLERRQKVVHTLLSVFFLVEAFVFNALKQFTALKVVQQQMDVLPRLVNLVQLDHVWMANIPQYGDLVEK